MKIKFRENWKTRKVEVFVDDKIMGAYTEYNFAAKMVQQIYHLSDADMMEIYKDYKADFDS
jgi:hypothetical protein